MTILLTLCLFGCNLTCVLAEQDDIVKVITDVRYAVLLS